MHNERCTSGSEGGRQKPAAATLSGAFPRQAYRRTFDRLLEKIPEASACRLMVALLALGHERGCEAELATLLTADLAAAQLPDIAALRARFAPDPAALPEVVVHLTPLIAYEALLGADQGEAA